MKKKLVAALALVLVCFSATSATAQDEAWFIDVETIPLGQTQLAITESGSFQNSSTRFSMPKGVGSTEFAVLCPKGQADGKCDFTSGLYDFNFTSVLPACSTSTQEDCVESLRIGTTTGALQEAKFMRQIKGTTFTYTDMARGLYEASTVSLWQSAGSDGLASQDYAVTVRTLGHYDAENDRYVTSSIDAAVSPYRLISGSKYSAGNLVMAPNPNTGSDSVTGWGFYSDCVWAEDGVCARALDFPADIKIQLTARVSNQITGWLKGRINAPEASIEKFSARNIRISLAAQPAIVPRFSVFFDEKTLAPSDLNLILNSDRTGNGDRLLRNMPPDRRGQDGKFMAFRWLEAFRSYAKDTAAAESSLWNFSTIDPGSGSECLAKADGMVGVVTTNATVYSGVAPSYADGMLSYSVAGMHYAPDGKRLNLGTYDLVMRSDVARCLYKFTNAPISATISVISDNGEEKAATTIVNEKDGWLYLRAAGFTFSAPRIQVKLTQAVAPAPSPSSSPSATPSASPEPAVSSTTTPSTEATTKPISKKITITCVKGKIIKKVTAVSPKCPAGYKKK